MKCNTYTLMVAIAATLASCTLDDPQTLDEVDSSNPGSEVIATDDFDSYVVAAEDSDMLATSEAQVSAAPCTGIWDLRANNWPFDFVIARLKGSTEIRGVMLDRTPGGGPWEVRGTCDGNTISFSRMGSGQQYQGSAVGDLWQGWFTHGGNLYFWETLTSL